MYFAQFPKIYYALNNEVTVVTDITRRTKLKKYILDNIKFFDQYVVNDGETPEILAHKVYGNAYYHWIIMMVNNIYSMNDWPMTSDVLDVYIKEKYGESNITNIHHYEDENGKVVSQYKFIETSPGVWSRIANSNLTSVTNFEYEEKNNDNRRKINLIRQEMITDFVDEVQKLIQTGV